LTLIADEHVNSWNSSTEPSFASTEQNARTVPEADLFITASGIDLLDERNDLTALGSLPRHRLHSAGSETLNWVTLGGAMHRTNLKMELLDYVPVYRTPAGTGGGWAFARWR